MFGPVCCSDLSFAQLTASDIFRHPAGRWQVLSLLQRVLQVQCASDYAYVRELRTGVSVGFWKQRGFITVMHRIWQDPTRSNYCRTLRDWQLDSWWLTCLCQDLAHSLREKYLFHTKWQFNLMAHGFSVLNGLKEVFHDLQLSICCHLIWHALLNKLDPLSEWPMAMGGLLRHCIDHVWFCNRFDWWLGVCFFDGWHALNGIQMTGANWLMIFRIKRNPFAWSPTDV